MPGLPSNPGIALPTQPGRPERHIHAGSGNGGLRAGYPPARRVEAVRERAYNVREHSESLPERVEWQCMPWSAGAVTATTSRNTDYPGILLGIKQ